MPILLYVPRTQGGPYYDSTLTAPGITKVVLTEKINQPYLPPLFDGRLILNTHGLRQRPVIMTESGQWLTARDFVKRYSAHFQYLKAHVKRIDLLCCHTGYSGFGEALAEELRQVMSFGPLVINAPTAQFTVLEKEQKWRVGMGGILPYVTGLSRLLVLGSFDRYSTPYGNMAWAGYPRLRRSPSFSRVYTALCKSRATRTTHLGSQWFGFGFKQFAITPVGS